ncbi:hypothetical protein HS088_TW09G00045 [Tripterygium wilfordii]|uniref:CUE domain-containing protein n=1 Tax=Tripterygium wilfordii TaxID=458696 RepID=A0A7J7D7I1_TRIWF|nr:uncharacterized protein LOC120006656 [Tripterygium wilfordii]KAF5742006.1 hypothetical protein HS088_TW09G00045 [Tripterygium wilfordii]
MSAIVCGKRSLFEDYPATSPPVSKRIRCSSSSPVRFSPPRSISNRSALIDHLLANFPEMDKQLIEKALEECGDDLDSAIRSLTELRLGSADRSLGTLASKPEISQEANAQLQAQGVVNANGEVPVAEDPSAPLNLQMEGAEWVELFVREMMSASNIDDARARASRALEVLEKSIQSCAEAEAARNFHQENMVLKEQVEALIHENTILKRAVAIQHERQKEIEDRSQELQQLKQLLSQYQEQLRTLEVNNYALTMHLKQAQQSNSIPGHFHPDVF